MMVLPTRPTLVVRERLGRVRPFESADLPSIVQLYERVSGPVRDSRALERHLGDIFWRHPWHRDGCPSLVYESGGRIVGCLGVMPRQMVFRNRPIVMAVGHHFLVDPARRSTPAGLELLRAFFGGSQQISIAEGNDSARRLWEAARGSTAWLNSLRWVRPLKPARYLVAALDRHGLPRANAVLGPIASAFDALTTGVMAQVFGRERVRLSGTELDERTLMSGIRELSDGASLRPEYDEQSVAWLLTQLARKPDYGSLQRVAVRNDHGDLVGWFLYYLRRGSTSEVLQLAARRRWISDVFDHLVRHARTHGAVALSGRLDAHLVTTCAGKQCFYRNGGSWSLVDSRDPELLNAIQRGDAFLTRLEGQWWMGYGGDAAGNR